MSQVVRSTNPIRFVTASALFDGHDASINIMRRMLQASGVEVIHLGHNRSAQEVVNAAISEDANGIAISSYQGGHIEYLQYMFDLLRQNGASHIRIFAGGGGVIIPSEIVVLEAYGIAKVFSPEDGLSLGLQGMIDAMIDAIPHRAPREISREVARLDKESWTSIARLITIAEEHHTTFQDSPIEHALKTHFKEIPNVPVIGVTGTGGAGKSSLTDELVRRFLAQYPSRSIAILSIDPSKMKTGGALLGDRIRMNAIHHPNVYMRSLATRNSRSEVSLATKDAIQIVKAAGFDLVLVETSGIGQGDAEIVALCDLSMYVMTSEFGAATQLEKIDMIDFADLIVINKFDRRGSLDALRDVRKQFKRSRALFAVADESLPIFSTMASQFNDEGTDLLFANLLALIKDHTACSWIHSQPESTLRHHLNSRKHSIIPPDRSSYLGEIVQTIRTHQKQIAVEVQLARQLAQVEGTKQLLQTSALDNINFMDTLNALISDLQAKMKPESLKLLQSWPEIRAQYQHATAENSIGVRFTQSLSGNQIPRVSVPKFEEQGEILRFLLKENLPGYFPFTAGVFPFKRTSEDPKRQFAGEGTPERTNRRFHYLSKNDTAKRLSTAFDSVTLYGEDPDWRPDIYGKIGNSGVSICTLDDMKKLYHGFNLCDPSTSVSMTINGPAPILLAMFMNTAIEQQVSIFTEKNGRTPLPDELEQIRSQTLQTVRGTVQADILKEDQGQNTCIFSTEFALKMMGDMQQYFIDHQVRNYYSVSISGYHIAEAGANPISQLAFTLANGFTYVEYYLSRGMAIDNFAPNLSFFFSNGLDPEYTVMGRVARRIWAMAMKYRYGANERSQKLKYHIQTSGRSLHAGEMDFNDIRTTLQALLAINDNCNSLHTNAYDEAVTTPTENSVRRAMAIQLIINKEFGLAKNENPLQGAFIIDELTDLVEERVLAEFERIHQRGGVLGAMETGYQRGKIQDESMAYEHQKHSGQLPIIGVNTFIHPDGSEVAGEIELARSTDEEKQMQIRHLGLFLERNQQASQPALEQLKLVARQGGNLFTELMDCVKVASLGQITAALYEVGGQYRRNM